MSRGRTVFVATPLSTNAIWRTASTVARQCAEKLVRWGMNLGSLYHMLITAIHLALWQRRCGSSSILNEETAEFESVTERYRQMLPRYGPSRCLPFLPAHRASQHSYHARPSRRGDIIQILQKLGGGTVIGPLLTGLTRAAQITPINANDADLVNFASRRSRFAGYHAAGGKDR